MLIKQSSVAAAVGHLEEACFEIGPPSPPLLFNSRIACFYFPAHDTEEDRALLHCCLIKGVLVWS